MQFCISNCNMGVEPKIGGFFPPKWMVKIMVPNPIEMDGLGVPLFLETPILQLIHVSQPGLDFTYIVESYSVPYHLVDTCLRIFGNLASHIIPYHTSAGTFMILQHSEIARILTIFCYSGISHFRSHVVEMEMFWFTHMCHYKFWMDPLAQYIAAVSVLCCGLLRQLLQLLRKVDTRRNQRPNRTRNQLKGPKKKKKNTHTHTHLPFLPCSSGTCFHFGSSLFNFEVLVWYIAIPPFQFATTNSTNNILSLLSLKIHENTNPIQSSKAILQIRRVVKHQKSC